MINSYVVHVGVVHKITNVGNYLLTDLSRELVFEELTGWKLTRGILSEIGFEAKATNKFYYSALLNRHGFDTSDNRFEVFVKFSAEKVKGIKRVCTIVYSDSKTTAEREIDFVHELQFFLLYFCNLIIDLRKSRFETISTIPVK